MSLKDIKWMKDKFEILISIFLWELPNKFHNIIHFLETFWHIKDLVNEGQTLNFYKHFIYKNFVMNFEIPGFVGFTGWIYDLDFIWDINWEIEKF